MPEFTFHIQELIAAIVFILTGGGLGTMVAKQKGWITFGRPAERRSCPDVVQKVCDNHTSMIVDIANLGSDVADLKRVQSTNTSLLNGIESKVDRLVGYHQGKNGVNLNN